MTRTEAREKAKSIAPWVAIGVTVTLAGASLIRSTATESYVERIVRERPLHPEAHRLEDGQRLERVVEGYTNEQRAVNERILGSLAEQSIILREVSTRQEAIREDVAELKDRSPR